MTALADTLHGAVQAGEWAGVDLATGVVLRSSSERGLRVIEGADAVRAHLAAPGPGAVEHWDVREWPTGAAITFQWTGAASVDRRRWYVHAEVGVVTAMWSYAARPKATGGDVLPPDVIDALAPGGRAETLEHGGNSGAALLRIATADGSSLIVKRIEPGGDWLARVTDDQARTAQLWDAGAFATMNDLVEHGITAVTHAHGASWVAMRDVAAHLLDATRTITRDESRLILGAAAGIHARFRGDVPAGLATLDARIGMSSPAVAEAERDSPDLLPKQFELAWEAFADAVPADVAEPVLRLARDPAPLADALRATGPLTLLHGDLRDDNLGFHDGRVVLLDWDLATAGTPSVEFAWFLLQDAWRIDASHDELEADYRAAEGDLDPREVELGMLSGLVQYGWVLGHSARVHPDPAETAWAADELAWWVPRVRTALERLGGAPA